MTSTETSRTDSGGGASAPRKRAPRHTLSPEVIVDQAVAVLDDKGPDGLTMRALATQLGVGPMALYTHFSSKDQLLDAVRDHLLRGLADTQTVGDWTDQLRATGTSLYRLLVAHPSLIHLFATRPLAGHEAAEATEAQLAALRAAGFDRVTAARAHLTLLHHALGAATWEVQLNAGSTDADSRRRRRAALAAMPADRYATIVDLAGELVSEATGEAQFISGLDLILAGLRTQLAP